ncbi:MAG TPA: response regulator transcription factor [Streptosporangiaceae bacterium]|nr:response regulator transcription factor [Streptosporangiaceae bacterium]
MTSTGEESVTGDAGPDEPAPLSVLIVDDQAVVRLGFTALLESQPDLTVVGQAGNGQQAIRLARQEHPDVVLMDIRMPVMDGITATREITAGPRPPRVLVLTTFDLDDYVYDALRAGASGFLLKDATPEEILRAVRVVGGGEALLAPAVTSRLIAEFASRAALVPPPELASLTPREHEVLLQVAAGLANAEIARRLGLAGQTVKSHVSSVLFKLGLRDRVQAVILAYESGLVVPGAGNRPDLPEA